MSNNIRKPRLPSNPSGSIDFPVPVVSSADSVSDSSSIVGASSSFDESAPVSSPVLMRAPTLRRKLVPDALTGWQSLLTEHRHYLLRFFIANARFSPQVQAIKLRKFACLSRQSYFDAMQIMNEKGFEAASLCGTRFAVPECIRFEDGDKNRKQKARRRIAQLVATHRHSYIDLSYNWKSLPNQKGLRAAITLGMLSAGSNKWLRIDLSNYRFSTLMQSNAYSLLNAEKWDKLKQDKEGPLLVTMLNKEFERVVLATDVMPAFDLICCDQPLRTVVYPLVKQLAALSKALPGLRSLNLNCLSMQDTVCAGRKAEAGTENFFAKFVKGLSTILVDSPTLEFLGLRGNGIGPRRLVTFARALQQDPVLERLDLSRNPLCNLPNADRMIIGGIRAFKKALVRNTKLTRLNLSFCGLRDKAADELLVALANNKTLQFLDLTGNSISQKHKIFMDARVVDRHRPAPLQNGAKN